MKAKYDIARLHKDCLAWCESPQWKPWMVAFGLTLCVNEWGFSIELESEDVVDAAVLCEVSHSLDNISAKSHLLGFAHFIGLDVESYRIPEIDRDQAVRDYLASIEEGAPLWEGSEWVKETIDCSVQAHCYTKERILLIGALTGVRVIAYTFLRLDLREDGK